MHRREAACAAIRAIHSIVLARCHSCAEPNSAIIWSREGMPIESKNTTLARSEYRAWKAVAIAVLPEPEAPVRTIKRMAPRYLSPPAIGRDALIRHPDA